MGIGGVWKRLLSPAANSDENHSPEWDAHGLRADIVVQLKKLSRLKRYKVSAIKFVDKVKPIVVSSNDSLLEIVSLRAGCVYTKSELQKELETLDNSGMVNKVDLEAKPNPDGTIDLTISFTEITWEKADYFRCINVGLMAQLKAFDVKENMSLKETVECMRNYERDYRLRMENARPSMLPSSVHGEILQMLGEGNVSARMLLNIRDKVHKWYHDAGYACAQVVHFGNMHTNELVCEVVEGDITEIVIQFEDKHGNVCEMNSHIGAEKRQLPEQLQKGNVFKMEIGRQALDNINSLSLFSDIQINPRPDEKNEGGIIVEIKLKELDGVSAEWSVVSGRGEGLER